MSNKKILIIEDDQETLNMYLVVLNGAGFEVISGVDGTDGLEKAKAEKPDLILLDIILPGISGFDVLAEMRRDSLLHSSDPPG